MSVKESKTRRSPSLLKKPAKSQDKIQPSSPAPSPWRHRIVLFGAMLSLSNAAVVSPRALAQGSSGTVSGTVTDVTGAVVPGATVVISNPVSGYSRTVTTDANGTFSFPNLPYNPYRLTVTESGFVPTSTQTQVSTAIPITLPLKLRIASSNETVNVEAPVDLTETDPNFHTDVDRTMIDRLPVESPSSQLSSIVTQLSPGVAADSNGLLHGLGDHNETSFSIDGQPVTDQQSKVFSNELPADAVQSLEVIEGAPPAEYGDKTSLVVVVTTRSGQGVKTPTGSASLSYGSFGTANAAFNVAYGGKSWGNFISVNGLESGRFLDAPEFVVMHDRGNEANLFDRADYQFTQADSMHVNFQFTRSWFQTPNSYDTQFGFVNSGATTGNQDQRSKIETVLVAPTYTRILNTHAVFNFAPYFRRDSYNYYPSNNLLNDLGPIQQESVQQYRTLTNAGLHSDVSYAIGPNSLKFGGMYSQTFLRENDTLGVVDPNLNDPAAATYNPVLAPYDLTRGGTTYTWHGRTDVKQLALYGEDSLTTSNWLFNFGIRGDIYNGLAIQRQGEPRVGISYNLKKTGTVLRVSYARTQETPFNENLVLSANGCYDPVINAVFSTIGNCLPAPFNPGFRNEFHAGFEQSAGRHIVVSAEWISKYTHNGYDFAVLGATPITFPIEWHNSKIPGYAGSVTLTELKGFTARFTASSVAARFFNPQVGGVGATPGNTTNTFPFRIDHDERFNQDTHLEYKMPFRKSMYYSFNWRYDSGLVAGSVPCYNVTDPNSACGPTSVTINGQPGINLSGLTYDEQFQSGLTCAGVKATPTSGFSQCLSSQLTSKLVSIPAAGTEDDDHDPQRITPRNLFDMQLGDDNVYHWHSDRFKLGATLTAINVTDKYALYNFLSTFSGTHYVTPRTVTGEIALHF